MMESGSSATSSTLASLEKNLWSERKRVFSVRLDWRDVFIKKLTESFKVVHKIEAQLRELAAVPEYNVGEWYATVQVLLRLLPIIDSINKGGYLDTASPGATATLRGAPRTFQMREQRMKVVTSVEEVSKIAEEMTKLLERFSVRDFGEISGNPRRRRDLQLLNNGLYERIKFIYLAWLQEYETFSGTSAPPELLNVEGSIEEFLTDPNAREFWKNGIKSRLKFMVTWDEFYGSLPPLIKNRMNKEEKKKLRDILDFSKSGLVSVIQFSEFLKGFGPFTTCIDTYTTIVNEPWFHGYVSRYEAERLLDMEPHGTFLVRLRDLRAGSFAIALVDVHSTNILHVAVENTESPGGGFKIKQTDKYIPFGSLKDIITAYQRVLKLPFSSGLNKREWFYGDLSGSEAKRLLQDQTKASFLVRFSAGNPNCLATAYVGNSNQIVHSLIEKTSGGFHHGTDRVFPTMEELINAYQTVLSFPFIQTGSILEDIVNEVEILLQNNKTFVAEDETEDDDSDVFRAASGDGSTITQRDTLRQEQVFGVPLASLLDPPTYPIPYIAEQCIMFLYKYAKTELLFQTSASATEVQKLKAKFDRGLGKEENLFKISNPHVVAQLLRVWLRELPIPLIPEAAFEHFMSITDRTPIDDIKRLLAALPPSHDLLLQYLLKLMMQIIRFQAESKMNSQTLSVVIGPNILRRNEANMEDSLKNASSVYTATRILIERATDLYPGIDKLSLDRIEVCDGKLVLDPSRKQIKEATVDKLIECLYADQPGLHIRTTMYGSKFRLTYQSFITSVELMNQLADNYLALETASDRSTDKNNKVSRAKICAFMRKWFQENSYEFATNTELNAATNRFVNAMTDANLRKLLEASLKKVTATAMSPVDRDFIFNKDPPKPYIPKKVKSLLDVRPIELARQMTILDYDLYRKIQPQELVEAVWTHKEHKEDLAPNVLAMSRQFNHIVHMLATQAVSGKKRGDRERVVRHLLELLKHLKDLNNFNGINGVLATFSQSGISRLKLIQKMMEENSLYKELKELMSPAKAFKNYRAALRTCNPPMVPFLGIFQTDLLMIHDGNPIIRKATNLVNFRKCYLTSDVIQEIQQYQQTPYNLKTVDIIQLYILKQADCWDEAKVYARSLEIQPRGSKKK